MSTYVTVENFDETLQKNIETRGTKAGEVYLDKHRSVVTQNDIFYSVSTVEAVLYDFIEFDDAKHCFDNISLEFVTKDEMEPEESEQVNKPVHDEELPEQVNKEEKEERKGFRKIFPLF